MKILVISDVHGHTKMFDIATQILLSGQADYAVQMGDLVDDWGKAYALDHYRETMQRAYEFHQQFPETIWLYGNHDFGYLYPEKGRRESGHSTVAEVEMREWLKKMEQIGATPKIMYLKDNVVFTHGGLTEAWVERQKALVGAEGSLSNENLLRLVNFAAPFELWEEEGPIWARLFFSLDSYQTPYPWKGLQIVGHTPVETIFENDGVVYTDVFSTYSDGRPFGEERMIIVDTKKGKWSYAKES